MISAPALHSFVHVGHVGINDGGTIEASKDIDSSWKAVLGGLHASDARMSSIKMVPVPDGHADFVEGFWKGVDAIDRGGNSSETTIANNDSKSPCVPMAPWSDILEVRRKSTMRLQMPTIT